MRQLLYHEIMDVLQKSRFTLWPLIMTVFVVAIDQLSKYIITISIPLNSYTDVKKVLGDFLGIVHVRNTGAAFSLGSELESSLRVIVLFIIPIALILYLFYASTFMKWHIRFKFLTATIAGGGIGNMIDRFLRPDGVVDFIHVKMYGLFGMEYWPTFNIADISIVISMLLWIAFTFFIKEEKQTLVTSSHSHEEKNSKQKTESDEKDVIHPQAQLHS